MNTIVMLYRLYKSVFNSDSAIQLWKVSLLTGISNEDLDLAMSSWSSELTVSVIVIRPTEKFKKCKALYLDCY